MLLYNKVIMGIREEQNMGNYTNEKGLVVVQDNFLTKIKNFFAKAFWNRKSKYQEFENEEEDFNQDYLENYEQKENVQKERRLYNFDADNNDDWPGDENMDNVDNEKNNEANNENKENQEENLEENYDREIYSEAYIEKRELEQKLLNYYESIKKRSINI